MTTLNVYGNTTLSTTLGTADVLVANTTGGGNSAKTALIGTATGYGELGGETITAAWPASGSLPAPTGKGWLLDSTVLEGQTIAAGTWTCKTHLKVSVGSLVATIYMRAYKRSSGGVYTNIGTASLAGQTINTTSTLFTMTAGTSFSSMDFHTGDKLYVDIWLNITSNATGSGAATATNVASNTASTGTAGNTEFDTPGYAATSGGGGGGGLLPGQYLLNGVSNLLFGTQQVVDFGNPHTVVNTSAIQAQFNTAGFTLMRLPVSDGATQYSDATIDARLAACTACGCLPLIIIGYTAGLTFAQHVVTYAGSRCNLYEFYNEPDIAPLSLSVSTYLSNWNSWIPTLRAINANAKFGGPALGDVANFNTFLKTWLQGTVTSGVLPDFVSFHDYPCGSQPSQSVCLTKAPAIGHDATTLRTLLVDVLGATAGNAMAIGVTEWNIDWHNPPVSYANQANNANAAFINDWYTNAIQSMANAGVALACQFDAAGNAESGQADLVSITSPYPAQCGFSAMSNAIAAFQASGGGTGSGGTSPKPYMVKMGSSSTSSGAFTSQAITDMQNLGATSLFYQIKWSDIDNSGSTAQTSAGYNWGAWDSAVSLCNAAGIEIYIAAFTPPSQFIVSGTSLCAIPSKMATFCQQIAQRYNGGAHGTIQGIYVGNEDYDTGGSGGQASNLVSVLKAVYPVIKAVNPSMLVIAAAKIQRSSSFYSSWFDTLLNPSTGAYTGGVFQADVITFHYHTAVPGPPYSLDPSVSTSTIPSFAKAISLIQEKVTAYASSLPAGLPVWADENGLNINANPGRDPATVITDATRWTYTQYELETARTSGLVQRYGIFTLGQFAGYPAPNYRDGESLIQGPLGAPTYGATFTGMKAYITKYPSWVISGPSGSTLTVSPANANFAATVGGTNPANQTVTLSNADTSSASYTVSDNATWLTVSPTSGTIAAGGTATSTLSVNTTGLAAGTYTAAVRYAAGSNAATVSVTLVVSPVSTPPPVTTTPLTAYFPAVASPVIPTANRVYTILGTPPDANVTTYLGAATGWGELVAQGTNATWAAAGSIGGPSGYGFVLGAKTLEGNSLLAGAYTAALRLNIIGASTVAITADIHCRLYVWNVATGYGAQIADCVLAGQTIGTTKSIFSPTFTTTATTDFGNGDKLYIDIKINVTANTNPTTAYLNLNNLSTDSVTFTGAATACVSTPGFVPTASLTDGGGTGGGAGGGTGTGGVANQVIVNNQSVVLLANTLLIQNKIGRRSTASFTVRTDSNTHFQQYHQVQIYDSQAKVAFNGYVTNPKEMQPGWKSGLLHTITCCDQHYLADKRIIAASYANRTAGYMVSDIVANYLAAEGVTVGSVIDPGVTIPSAIFAYCTAADALDALAQGASQAGIPYYWMIDSAKLLWFVPYTAIVNSKVVDGTNVDDGQRSGVVPSLTRANPTYRNTQYILGGVAQTATQTEIQIGDGNKQSFSLGYALGAAPTISVSLNGGAYGAQTVGVKGSSGSQWYWAQGDPVVTQDSGQTVLRGPTGTVDKVKVIYTGQFPTVINDQNSGQVSYQQSLDNTSGLNENVVNDTTLTSITNGLSEASQLLTRYATQGEIFEFATLDSSYQPGQLITCNFAPFGLQNAQMLIESVDASDGQDGVNVWFKVNAILGPYDMAWVDFFSKMLKQPQPANSINIGTGQSVLLSASGALAISETWVGLASPYACPLPSSTLFPSSTLYPC